MNYMFGIFFVIFIGFVVFLYKTFQLPGRIHKAEEFMEEENFTKASEIVKKIIDKKKDYVPALYIKARLFIQQKQYLLAVAEINNILGIPGFTKFVDELDLHYHLAELYNLTQNWQKEIDEYKIILTFNPDDINANHRIGFSFYNGNNFKKSKEHLLKAIVLDPNLKECLLPLGISCYYISDFEKSEIYLSKALDFEKDKTEVQYFLGNIYKMKKNYDNALQMLELSSTNKKYYLGSLFSLGEIAFEQENYDQAIEYLEQGLNSIDDKTEEGNKYRYLLAECFELKNKINEAVHHWNRIIAENPNFRSAKAKLDAYKNIIENKNLEALFLSSLEELQPLIVELISGLNYNIISKDKITSNEYQYKAYNIKRINDPPILINFNRTTREITETEIIEFHKKLNEEKCKSGIYVATSNFSLRAKSVSTSKMIELFDKDFVVKAVEKISSKKKLRNNR